MIADVPPHYINTRSILVSYSKAAFGIADVRNALIERAQSTLRHVVGVRVLQSLVTEREEIAREIEEIVEQCASPDHVPVPMSLSSKDLLFLQVRRFLGRGSRNHLGQGHSLLPRAPRVSLFRGSSQACR